MDGEAEALKTAELNRMIKKELLDLAEELKAKAAAFERQGKLDKAATCRFLAGYLKGAAEMWTE